MAKLVGGVAVIKVGAATETEMKEKKARVEDAMHATRAAVEEGIVPGGGVALARCAASLEKVKAEGDEQIGINIVKRAITEPLRQIVENAGEEGAVILGKVLEAKDTNFGFNAFTNEYEDLVVPGVARPDESRAHRPAERRLHRQPDAHHRSPGSGDSRKEGSSRPRRPRRRRHGRHVLGLAVQADAPSAQIKAPLARAGLFSDC